jgi:hypothetical protein
MVLQGWAGWARRAPPAVAAVGLGGLIVLSRVPLQGVLGATSPFLLSWPAIMLAAFLGGFWPATAVSHLVEPFVSGKADGMGIVLAVSRSIVEAHGGEIRAEARPGGGAVFCFTLRRAS